MLARLPFLLFLLSLTAPSLVTADDNAAGQKAGVPTTGPEIIGTPQTRAVAATALRKSVESLDRASIMKVLLADPVASQTLEKFANASGLKAAELLARDLQGAQVSGGAPVLIVLPSYDAWNWSTGIHFPAIGDMPRFMSDGREYNVGSVDGYGCSFYPDLAGAGRDGAVSLVTKYAFAELWLDLPDAGLYAVTIHLAPNLVGESLANWLARTPCPISAVANGERLSLIANPGRSALTALATLPAPLRAARVPGLNMRRVNCNLWLRLEAPPGVTSPSNALFAGFTITRL